MCPPDPILATVRPFRIRQKMNKPPLPAMQARGERILLRLPANVQQAKGKLSKRL
jgi:hypothetical protein